MGEWIGTFHWNLSNGCLHMVNSCRLLDNRIKDDNGPLLQHWESIRKRITKASKLFQTKVNYRLHSTAILVLCTILEKIKSLRVGEYIWMTFEQLLFSHKKNDVIVIHSCKAAAFAKSWFSTIQRFSHTLLNHYFGFIFRFLHCHLCAVPHNH